MSVYYNEIDPEACAALEGLMKAGFIAKGFIDNRSIEDVRPHEIENYDQCHFFAGEGIWSASLRAAGWRDDRRVWTASCPCQPFSAAGKGAGVTDERHLWPALHHLILHAKRPDVPLFGEQVANGDGLAWLDLVWDDMEAAGHSLRAFDFCAAGVGAPHIRQRLYFVADAESEGHPWGEFARAFSEEASRRSRLRGTGGHSEIGWLADYECARLERHGGHGLRGFEPRWFDTKARRSIREESVARILDDAQRVRWNPRGNGHNRRHERHFLDTIGAAHGAGPLNGFWRTADWLFCTDGKWRPVEPSSFPLADGAVCRVGRLRCHGNGIVAEQATIFIEIVCATLAEKPDVRLFESLF